MNRQTNDDKGGPAKVKYVCPYCRWTFMRTPRYSAPRNEFGKPTKHGGCSDQIKCPICGNFLRTWDGGDKK